MAAITKLLPAKLQPYAKAVIPAATGVVAGVVLIIAGQQTIGLSVLAAGLAAAGITWQTPNLKKR